MQTPVEKIEQFCKDKKVEHIGQYPAEYYRAMNEVIAFARSLLAEEKEGIEKAYTRGNIDGGNFKLNQDYFNQTYKQ